MKKEIIEIEVQGTGKGIKQVNKLEKSIKGVKTETKKVGEASKELSGNVDRLAGGAIGRFKGMFTSIKTVVKGFNLMKVAIIGTGIGALLIALLAVKKAFTSSEDGQNKFAKIMGVIGSVTGNLIDLLADLGEKITWVFENPKKAINDFTKLIKENIINRFEGLLELIPQLGKAVTALFSGNFSEAGKIAVNAVAKVTLGTDNLTESIGKAGKKLKEFNDELIREAKIAGEIADKRAKADKIERKLLVERALADRDIADLRFKAEQRDKFNAEERIKFLKEASKISEDITNKEIAATKLRLDARITENKLTKTTKEDKDKEAQLEAQLIQLQTKKLNLQKRLQTSITTFTNEVKAQELADEKKKAEDKTKEIADETKRQEAIKAIRDEFKKKQEDADAQTEIEKIELEKERQLAKLTALQEGLDTENEVYKNAEIEKRNIEDFYLQKSLDASHKAALEKIRDEELIQKQKLNLTKNTFNQLAMLLGKNSKAAKVASIAAALINTYQGITEVWSKKAESPFLSASIAQKVIASAFVASQGFAAVKNIAKTKVPAGSTGASSGGGVSIPQIQTPSFNIVGQSGTNQLATAIGNQTQQPVQAYVVSSAVSTAQELDRNIIEASSLG